MKAYETQELELLAQAAGKAPVSVYREIVDRLVSNKIIDGNEDLWGASIGEICNEDATLGDIANVLTSVGIHPVKHYHVGALMRMIYAGDGECPECGGEMEVTESENRVCGGDGYELPYIYTPVWEERTCRNCGHRELI